MKLFGVLMIFRWTRWKSIKQIPGMFTMRTNGIGIFTGSLWYVLVNVYVMYAGICWYVMGFSMAFSDMWRLCCGSTNMYKLCYVLKNFGVFPIARSRPNPCSPCVIFWDHAWIRSWSTQMGSSLIRDHRLGEGFILGSTNTVTNRTVPGRQSLSSKPLPNNVTQTQLAILKANHNLKLHAYHKRRKTVLVAACSKERI
jgi:hypothetical protein